MKGFFKKQFTFMIYGIVFWLPVALVAYIAILFFGNAEKIGKTVLGVAVPDRYLYAGLGTALCLLIVYFSGMILKLTKLGTVFHKIPVIGLFFGQGEIITINRLLNMRPCLFLLSPTCMSYGWIFTEEKVTISGEEAVFTLLNVYYQKSRLSLPDRCSR